MKAALLVEPNRIEIQEVPTPLPGRGEVLVKIKEAGICGTDFALFSGHLPAKYPIIPGHEAVGVIEALGPEVQGLGVGQRVTIQPNFPCGKCEICLSGKGNICLNKTRLGLDIDGIFAQYVSIPYHYIWALPEELAFPVATLTEPLAVAIHAFNKSPSSSGERVLVYGAGAIGLFFVRLAVLSGAWVGALDIAEPRLTVARALGAHKTFCSLTDLEEESGNFSVVYETSGTTDAFSRIVKLCAPGGRIVLTGLPEGEFPVLTSQIVRRELVVQGSMIYKDEFPAAIDLLKTGKIKPDLFISETYPLERLSEALGEFRSPERVKTLIQIP